MSGWDRPTPVYELTKPHRALHMVLGDSRYCGLQVEDEVEVGPNPKRAFYRIDCFVREVWCGFECDGKRIHAGIKKQKSDRARDLWIWEHAGIPIMRIQADALQFKLWDELVPQIKEFIESYSHTISERRALGEFLGV